MSCLPQITSVGIFIIGIPLPASREHELPALHSTYRRPTERNDISADVILAKELKRLISWWHAFVKGIDACLACHHAVLISVPTRSA
jgi:hypothetical protein